MLGEATLDALGTFLGEAIRGPQKTLDPQRARGDCSPGSGRLATPFCPAIYCLVIMHQNVKFNCSVNECCSKWPVYTAKFRRGYGRSRFALTRVQNPLTTCFF